MNPFARCRTDPGVQTSGQLSMVSSTDVSMVSNNPKSRPASSSKPKSSIALTRSASSNAAMRSSSVSTRSLLRKDPSFSRYQTTSITKHYEMNMQLLQAYDQLYQQQMYPNAYAMGIQFLETALIEIPKHGYFNSPRHERERMQSALEAVRVTQQLQVLCSTHEHSSYMDPKRLYRLHQLALKQVEEASQDQYENARQQVEEEIRNMDSDSWIHVCEPLLTCSESWTSVICPQSTHSVVLSPETTTLPDEVLDSIDFVSEPDDDDDTSIENIVFPSEPQVKVLANNDYDFPNPSLPESSTKAATVMLPPRPPRSTTTQQSNGTAMIRSSKMQSSANLDNSASFSDPIVLSRQRSSASAGELRLEKALYLSGVDLIGSNDSYKTALTSPTGASHHTLSIEVLSQLYHEDFDQLRNSGRIRISFVDTYQGRIPGSTNGCTVIAPLLCMHHLLEDFNMQDPGLNDAIITHVVDNETPSILDELRTSLGLSPQAFLIPSDVHDYLLDRGQLSSEQFVTVAGGNILDESHLDEFLKTLQSTEQRLAACFFFHEHVVAITQLRRNEEATTIWYDIIDGLPFPEFLMKHDESEHEFVGRLSLTVSQECLIDAFVPKTARIRCLNIDALKACLQWYACSKFTSENVHYIDSYAWDDNNTDFDPRVFQAYIWGSFLREI